MNKIVNLKDLFVEQLRDRYDSAKQQLEIIPKLTEQSEISYLKGILEKLRARSQKHVAILEGIFLELDLDDINGERCEATKALIYETMEIIERASDPQVLEAGLVISLQHIIHHDISGFGACRSYAKALGLKKATDQLDTMLKDEKEIDGELTQLAITRLNEEAIAPIIES